MYLVEVAIRRAAYPYRVADVATDTRVREIVESALAAWGIASPDTCAAGVAGLLEQLAETGEYRAEEPEYQVLVKQTR